MPIVAIGSWTLNDGLTPIVQLKHEKKRGAAPVPLWRLRDLCDNQCSTEPQHRMFGVFERRQRKTPAAGQTSCTESKKREDESSSEKVVGAVSMRQYRLSQH